MNFSYVAFDRGGKATRGAVDSGSESEARENLRARGLFVTELVAAANAAPAPAGKVSPLARFGGGKGRRLRNLVTFTRQLHVLVSSGTPLVQALGALERPVLDSCDYRCGCDPAPRPPEENDGRDGESHAPDVSGGGHR